MVFCKCFFQKNNIIFLFIFPFFDFNFPFGILYDREMKKLIERGGETVAESPNYFINLGTVTYAHKAQKILEANSIKSVVGKISDTSGNRGCSYGVYVKSQKKDEATLLLRASSIKIL